MATPSPSRHPPTGRSPPRCTLFQCSRRCRFPLQCRRCKSRPLPIVPSPILTFFASFSHRSLLAPFLVSSTTYRRPPLLTSLSLKRMRLDSPFSMSSRSSGKAAHPPISNLSLTWYVYLTFVVHCSPSIQPILIVPLPSRSLFLIRVLTTVPVATTSVV